MIHVNEKINNFAQRCFRDEADADYIAARMMYQGGLIGQFLWSSLHSLEKYFKYILLVNRVVKPNKHLGHNIKRALCLVREKTPCNINFVDKRCEPFIERINELGSYRYREYSQYFHGDDIDVLDATVWSVRRFCTIINKQVDGKDLSKYELKKIRDAENEPHYKFKLQGGRLEQLIENMQGWPEVEALQWRNKQFFDNQHGLIMRRGASANSPLEIYPEIFDELDKYIYFPKKLREKYMGSTSN